MIQATGNAPQKLSAYLRTYTGNVHYQVVSVDEDDETADALRAIKDKIDVNEFLNNGRTRTYFIFFVNREISLSFLVISLPSLILVISLTLIEYMIPLLVPCFMHLVQPKVLAKMTVSFQVNQKEDIYLLYYRSFTLCWY